MPKLYILHDNEAWLASLKAALSHAGIEYETWDLKTHSFDLGSVPPAGIFFNRVSPSAHSRGAAHSMALAMGILSWLEAHGRTVLGSREALALEMSKISQTAALHQFGLGENTPKTVAAAGPAQILAAAQQHFPDSPFFLKHNRGGSGLGVRRFDSTALLREYLWSAEYEESVDGLHILMAAVATRKPEMFRLEFVAGRLVYAMRVRTSDSQFHNCPADSCNDDGSSHGLGGGGEESKRVTPAAATAKSFAAIGSVNCPAHEEEEAAAASMATMPALPSTAFGALGGGSLSSSGDFYSLGADDTFANPFASILSGGGGGGFASTAASRHTTQPPPPPKFQLVADFQDGSGGSVVAKLEAMLTHFGCATAGVEVLFGGDGRAQIIDCNCLNTNYNSRAEAAGGRPSAALERVVALVRQAMATAAGSDSRSVEEVALTFPAQAASVDEKVATNSDSEPEFDPSAGEAKLSAHNFSKQEISIAHSAPETTTPPLVHRG